VVTNRDGTPRDITGAIPEFSVYSGPGASGLVITGTSVVMDGPGGVVVSSLEDDQTVADPFHVFWFEVVLTELDGTVSTIADGFLTIG
jgi:hypothetical protein